jgi:hypothetical protein
MGKVLQNLIALNIDLFGVSALAFGMMVLWSRATRGKWPNRTKVAVFAGVCVACWIIGNLSFFYFRAH